MAAADRLRRQLSLVVSFMKELCSVFIILLFASCVMHNPGPDPQQVFSIDASKHSEAQILAALNGLIGTLRKPLDLSRGRDDATTIYWYSNSGSSEYGVSLMRLAKGNMWDEDRYFVDVYTKEEPCALCGSVSGLLSDSGIDFVAECDLKQQTSSLFESRCNRP